MMLRDRSRTILLKLVNFSRKLLGSEVGHLLRVWFKVFRIKRNWISNRYNLGRNHRDNLWSSHSKMRVNSSRTNFFRLRLILWSSRGPFNNSRLILYLMLLLMKVQILRWHWKKTNFWRISWLKLRSTFFRFRMRWGIGRLKGWLDQGQIWVGLRRKFRLNRGRLLLSEMKIRGKRRDMFWRSMLWRMIWRMLVRIWGKVNKPFRKLNSNCRKK